MSQYVLIHGGDRDGSIWEAIAISLQQQGHTVFCPSMKSVTTASLDENIEQIVDLIKTQQLQEIILIGHSYGAMVITGVADQLPEHIAHLVFVDSVIPKNGQSLYSLLQEHGLDYKAFGLTADRACLEPLSFNEQQLITKSKTYIHCLQSEFLEIARPIYQHILEHREQEHWTVFCLDAPHGCMFTHPQELAIIFKGLSSQTQTGGTP